MSVATYSFPGTHNNYAGDRQSNVRSVELPVTGYTRLLPSWFLGEEKPGDMMVLLAILVVLIHIWGWLYLNQPIEQSITPAQPLMMEVSMIGLSIPKPVVAPPEPVVPPSPPPEKKVTPVPKKTLKPVVTKKKAANKAPVQQQTQDFAPAEPMDQVADSSESQASNSASVSHNSQSTGQNQTFTEANFKANYAHNPKPIYPVKAKNRGWQGKVLLKVNVSAEGHSKAIAIHQSSGHDVLDESAMEAVWHWRFIPAKRGETAVESLVIVPIIFSLR